MREITWSVKGNLNVLAVVLDDVDLPYWTLKVEHLVAFTAIFSNICTAHAQKRLFIRRPRFPVRVQNFGDLATFSVDFCILYAECPPYFYFRFVWPTDLESIPHASTPTSIIPTKFEAPTPIRFWVMSDNVSHWLPLKIMHTQPLRMRRITWPVSGGQKQVHFWNSRPRFAYSLYTFIGLRRGLRVVYSRASPMLKPRLRKFLVRDLVTLTFDFVTLNSCRTWRVTWPTLPPNIKTLRLFVHELRVITVPID